MLKYKFEKYILLVARIKKNKIFNFKSDLHWTWIHIYSSFVLGNFGSQAVAAVWTTVNDLEKMFVYRLSLFPFSRFFHPFPKQIRKAVHRPSIALHLTLRFKTSSHTQGQIVGARESLNGRFFFPALLDFPLSPLSPLGQLGNGLILAGACGHV